MGKGQGYKGGWKTFSSVTYPESICSWLVSNNCTRLGIDSFCWLHRIASMHSSDLVMHRNFDNIVSDFLVQAVSVQQSGLSQIFIFDGKPMDRAISKQGPSGWSLSDPACQAGSAPISARAQSGMHEQAGERTCGLPYMCLIHDIKQDASGYWASTPPSHSYLTACSSIAGDPQPQTRDVELEKGLEILCRTSWLP